MRVPFVKREAKVFVAEVFGGPMSKVELRCDTTGTQVPRALRADAQRNRARILEAAEVLFAAEGIEAGVDSIAEKAGVGVGTLYRHFPTKERLCQAVLLERLSHLAIDARALGESDDPGEAFFGFVEHFIEEGAAKRDLVVAVMGAGEEFEVSAADVKEELCDALGVLLRRAQSAGAVRPDVTELTVMSLAGATCHAAAHANAAPATDLLTIICDGLRPQISG
jgi:AcrR family transcriptional regulator